MKMKNGFYINSHAVDDVKERGVWFSKWDSALLSRKREYSSTDVHNFYCIIVQNLHLKVFKV